MAKHLCSWAGLTPQNNESAGKRRPPVSAVPELTSNRFVQCALAVAKSDKHPEIKSRYLALKKRRGHKKAIIAICRMLLTAIYAILKKSEAYNPNLYRKENPVPANREFTIEQAIRWVQRHGYVVSEAAAS